MVTLNVEPGTRERIRNVFIRKSFNISSPETDPGLSRGVEYLQSPLLSGYNNLFHGVFTRRGGISERPYDTLNTSYDVGDQDDHVRENLSRIKHIVPSEDLRYMHQVHGRDILVLRRGNHRDLKSPQKADALITNLPHLALMVKQADCQGVILFDPVKKVVSTVHCGWRGSTHNILGAVLKRMASEFGCNARDLVAAVGPSLGPCCAEFRTYKQIFPADFRRFMVSTNYFNLWELTQWQLIEGGLLKKNIETAGICTRCRTDLFFSYRAEGETGRFATVAMIK